MALADEMTRLTSALTGQGWTQKSSDGSVAVFENGTHPISVNLEHSKYSPAEIVDKVVAYLDKTKGRG